MCYAAPPPILHVTLFPRFGPCIAAATRCMGRLFSLFSTHSTARARGTRFRRRASLRTSPRSPTKAAAAGLLVDRTATALLVVTAQSLACVTGEEEENECNAVCDMIHVHISTPPPPSRPGRVAPLTTAVGKGIPDTRLIRPR